MSVGSENESVKFDFYKYDSLDLIYKYSGSGQVSKTLIGTQTSFPMQNHIGSRHFEISHAKVQNKTTFLDFIFSGFSIDLSIGIDFS